MRILEAVHMSFISGRNEIFFAMLQLPEMNS